MSVDKLVNISCSLFSWMQNHQLVYLRMALTNIKGASTFICDAELVMDTLLDRFSTLLYSILLYYLIVGCAIILPLFWKRSSSSMYDLIDKLC